MSKVAIVYWSGTGNTESMADFVLQGAKENGSNAEKIECTNFESDKLDKFDAVAFGCPSMGAEELEDSEFQPMFNNLKDKLSGKKIALFGSYGWGDGEWMRGWDAQCKELGANMVCDFVIANEAPDSDAQAACKNLGAALSNV